MRVRRWPISWARVIRSFASLGVPLPLAASCPVGSAPWLLGSGFEMGLIDVPGEGGGAGTVKVWVEVLTSPAAPIAFTSIVCWPALSEVVSIVYVWVGSDGHGTGLV